MRFFLFCSFILFRQSVFGDPTQNRAEAEKIAITCMKETGVTAETITKYQPGEEPTNEEVLCFIKCTFEKYGYLNKEGIISIDRIKETELLHDHDDVKKEKIYECLDRIEKISTCQDTFAMEKCIVNV